MLIVNFYLPTYTNAQAIAGGYEHSISLCKDNTVKAWGDYLFGQLGDGGTLTDDTSIPGM